MATEKRLIDADALLAEFDKFANPMPNKSGYDFLCGIATAITEIEDAPTVDAVEVDAIQAWLYEIAMNNTGDVSRVCEELISRLDGLRVFAEERRTNEG